MAYPNKTAQSDFRINFQSMPQATEWLIVLAMRVRINAAIMGRQEKISATNQVKNMIPSRWQDKTYTEQMNGIEKNYRIKQAQAQSSSGLPDTNKMNEAIDSYSDDTFKAIWNLLDRIGKLPQQSEVSEE